MYFVFTTITTVGFGDFFPTNDIERAIWCIVLLGGVAVFSYFMGFLLEMILKVQNLDKNFENEEDLEKFFLLLRKFNGGSPTKPQLVQQIRQ